MLFCDASIALRKRGLSILRKEMSSPKNARPQASSTSRSFKVLRLLSPSLDCLAGDDQLLLRLSSCARLRFATLKSFCSCFSLIIATNFFLCHRTRECTLGKLCHFWASYRRTNGCALWRLEILCLQFHNRNECNARGILSRHWWSQLQGRPRLQNGPAPVQLLEAFFFFPVTKIIPRGANQILRVFFYSYSPVTIFTGSDWIFFEHPGVGNYLCS